MLEIWNDSSILPPPVLTFLCSYNFDSDGLLYTCNEIIRVLSKQSPLHQEGAILSRLVYKFDKKFRNDIGYRNFKKVNTALKRYLSLNFVKDVEAFTSILPSDSSEQLYLPTRQMLEYLLVRLQTFSKIMMRICICSKQTAIFYLDRIKRGESHWMSLMPYAVLSRVWSISSVLITHCSNWYRNLHRYLDNLQLKGMPFLPADYSLPTDLAEWLDLKNIEELGKYEWAKNKVIHVIPILDEIEETDGTFDIFKYVTEINDEQQSEEAPIPEVVEMNEINNHFKQKELSLKIDQGEVISREAFKNANNKTKSDCGQPVSRLNTNISSQLQKLQMFKDNKSNTDVIKTNEEVRRKEHCAEKVTSSDSLKHFIKKEEKYRNSENPDSLTGHLSFMQWQALKGTLMKLCDLLANNRKIQRKFQKIWKEKCLDYL